MSETFASLVGKRLKEAREQLGLSQAEAAQLVGVTREHWGRCERGLAVPGGEVLAALATAGTDVLYVLTGQYAGGVKPAPALSADEQELLSLFRTAPLAVKAAAIGALQGGAAVRAASGNLSQRGSGNVQVGHGGTVSGIVQTNHGHGSVQVGQVGAPPRRKR